MTRVLVLGGSGIVGRFLIPRLVAAGYGVVAPSRTPVAGAASPATSRPQQVEWMTLDLAHADAVDRLPKIERVVSMLPIEMTAKVCRAMTSDGPLRVIAFSSTSVVTKADSDDARERSLARRLLSGEDALLSLGPRVSATVLRPTMIYGGPGDRNVERIASQLTRVRLFPLVAKGRGLRQPVHADDLAIAVVQVLAASHADARRYDLSGAEILTVRSLVERVGNAHGVTPLFVNIPLMAAKAALAAAAVLPRFRGIPRESVTRMSKDMVFDHGPAARDFGFHPRGFEPAG